MKKKENNRGITLIALVITIIIMIILVAVSVALAVKGDLFGNAQEGTEQTRKEAEKEQLTEYVYGQYRQNESTKKVEVNLDNVKAIVDGDEEKFNGAAFEGDTLKVTGKSGQIYYVNKNGKIGDENSNIPDWNGCIYGYMEEGKLALYKPDYESKTLIYFDADIESTSDTDISKITACELEVREVYPMETSDENFMNYVSKLPTTKENDQPDWYKEGLNIGNAKFTIFKENDYNYYFFLNNDFSVLYGDENYTKITNSVVVNAANNLEY